MEKTELTLFVRWRYPDAGFPIIIMSVTLMEQMDKKEVLGEVDIAQKLGVGKYVNKPYVLEKIGVAVKEALEK